MDQIDLLKNYLYYIIYLIGQWEEEKTKFLETTGKRYKYEHTMNATPEPVGIKETLDRLTWH